MAPPFKTYDIRGRLPQELNPQVATSIARAYAKVTQSKTVAIGHDARLSSPELTNAVKDGLVEMGVEVLDIGLCGTEIVYFAVQHLNLDGGIMVTASHNPADYNGMKMVVGKAVPVSIEQLAEIEKLHNQGVTPVGEGHHKKVDIWEDYLQFLKKFAPPETLPACKIVCDGGNGAVGPLLERLGSIYPQLELVLQNAEPDGTFPNGIPNPLLPENREGTAQAVRTSGAALGVAWDGDYDRCFFWDENAEFVETYHLIGEIAASLLNRTPGAPILYDPRLTWSTINRVREAGGKPTLCRTGHVFFKQQMAANGGIYGAEMSGHHYFKDFANCDSGVLPFLVVLQLLKEQNTTLSQVLDKPRSRYHISGEINQSVADAEQSMQAVAEVFTNEAKEKNTLDGLSMEFEGWRFNLRPSNTEPLLRLNVESDNQQVMEQKTQQILGLIEKVGSEAQAVAST